MPYPWTEDQCAYDAAVRLARQVEAHWRDKGFKSVRCEAVQFESGQQDLDRFTSGQRRGERRPQFGVRSNLVAGLPPDHPRVAHLTRLAMAAE